MELVLADSETEVLRTAVKHRIDTLLMGLSKTDSFKNSDPLQIEIDALEEIYRKLGCVHETGTEGERCAYVGKKDSPEAWLGDAD